MLTHAGAIKRQAYSTSLLGRPSCLARMASADRGSAVLPLAPLLTLPCCPCIVDILASSYLCLSRGSIPLPVALVLLSKRVKWDFPDILETNCKRWFVLKCSWQVYRWFVGFCCVVGDSVNP